MASLRPPRPEEASSQYKLGFNALKNAREASEEFDVGPIFEQLFALEPDRKNADFFKGLQDAGESYNVDSESMFKSYFRTLGKIDSLAGVLKAEPNERADLYRLFFELNPSSSLPVKPEESMEGVEYEALRHNAPPQFAAEQAAEDVTGQRDLDATRRATSAVLEKAAAVANARIAGASAKAEDEIEARRQLQELVNYPSEGHLVRSQRQFSLQHAPAVDEAEIMAERKRKIAQLGAASANQSAGAMAANLLREQEERQLLDLQQSRAQETAAVAMNAQAKQRAQRQADQKFMRRQLIQDSYEVMFGERLLAADLDALGEAEELEIAKRLYREMGGSSSTPGFLRKTYVRRAPAAMPAKKRVVVALVPEKRATRRVKKTVDFVVEEDSEEVLPKKIRKKRVVKRTTKKVKVVVKKGKGKPKKSPKGGKGRKGKKGKKGKGKKAAK